MATSLSNAGVLLAYRAPQQETFSTKVYFPFLRSGKNTTRTRPLGRVFAITSDSPGSSVQSLKTKEQMANGESIYDLATSWKKLHGEDNWAGLLDPLNMVLRKEILKYGEMVQACYDSFNFDPYSKYCGSCRFPKEEFFNGVGMRDHGYDVTRYLYATSNLSLPNFFRKSRWPRIWSTAANWIGYVSVSDDNATKLLGRRDITIAWRGTVTNLEWIADITATLHRVTDKNIPCPDSDVKVESGFLDLYTDKDEKCEYCNNSARDQILAEVKRLIDLYPNDELSITIGGHSLGSALATLSAYDIVESGLNVDGSGRVIPVCVFSFCGPRVGNFQFKERLEKLGVKMLRIVNVHDIVPKAPGLLVNEDAPVLLQKMLGGMPWAYHHAGVELELDHEHSPYLRKEDIDKVGNSHNLEAILHLMAGYKGKGEEFELQVDRDIALVNKSCDFLEDSYLIPPVWWQFEYKGLVRTTDGKWVQPEIPQLQDHLRP